ncbi:hypothetical protein E2C01_068746 [Portunus trituberculatus]|uniref:Uncharacterized protein n=1 Tax=Portunus trituberculatus TaxID=210409 RepID=A0A5B7I0C8_PORTR|nr:hypothetical protein [Portunus trituberculatus]
MTSHPVRKKVRKGHRGVCSCTTSSLPCIAVSPRPTSLLNTPASPLLFCRLRKVTNRVILAEVHRRQEYITPVIGS